MRALDALQLFGRRRRSTWWVDVTVPHPTRLRRVTFSRKREKELALEMDSG
jgi:hypothetical protein